MRFVSVFLIICSLFLFVHNAAADSSAGSEYEYSDLQCWYEKVGWQYLYLCEVKEDPGFGYDSSEVEQEVEEAYNELGDCVCEYDPGFDTLEDPSIPEEIESQTFPGITLRDCEDKSVVVAEETESNAEYWICSHSSSEGTTSSAGEVEENVDEEPYPDDYEEGSYTSDSDYSEYGSY